MKVGALSEQSLQQALVVTYLSSHQTGTTWNVGGFENEPHAQSMKHCTLHCRGYGGATCLILPNSITIDW